ncbi:hypothetical protein [Nocardia sp. NPDC057227]|uniref:hypothetical protein n=1 Tax=Nocardia sp. NPDC057227 TaxID=3346056 RepID=UPI00363BA717
MPFDESRQVGLVRLQQWIAQVCSEYLPRSGEPDRDYDRLRMRQATLNALSSTASVYETTDHLRALMAAGLVRYRDNIHAAGSVHIPESVFLGLVTETVWPIVCASALPRDWTGCLTALSNPTLVRVIAEVRGRDLSKAELMRNIATQCGTEPLWRILNDFNDPRRGAPFVIALCRDEHALASGDRQSWVQRYIFTGLRFVAVAAVAGVIGNRTDDVVVDGWEWIQENAPGRRKPRDPDPSVAEQPSPTPQPHALAPKRNRHHYDATPSPVHPSHYTDSRSRNNTPQSGGLAASSVPAPRTRRSTNQDEQLLGSGQSGSSGISSSAGGGSSNYPLYESLLHDAVNLFNSSGALFSRWGY